MKEARDKIPDKEDFINGIEAYKKYEKRDAMYKMATFLVNHFWGNYSDITDGLGVLLLTWNQAAYRYGSFDFDRLENCISNNIKKIEFFRDRDIFSLSDSDKDKTEELFIDFNEALKYSSGKNQKYKKSPVGVAKALHILAPNFFPLWDQGIADAYDCNYQYNPSQKYFDFCLKIKEISEVVKSYRIVSNKTIIKLIDEYNYSKYTKNWI